MFQDFLFLLEAESNSVGFLPVWFCHGFSSVPYPESHSVASGIRTGGGLGDLLAVPAWDDIPHWYWRQIYDLSFFVCIVIIWLNILFGVPRTPSWTLGCMGYVGWAGSDDHTYITTRLFELPVLSHRPTGPLLPLTEAGGAFSF